MVQHTREMDTKKRSLSAFFAIQLLYIVCERQHLSSEATSNGINVTIMGASVDNDGYIAIDLLDSEEKVECITNSIYCCNSKSGILGNWFFPNGSLVLNRNKSGYAPFFARNRNYNVVRLFRVDNGNTLPSQRGRFCCEVPDDENATQRYYVNILNISEITLIPSGSSTKTAGEINFTLNCSAQIILPMNVSPPTFEWFYGPGNASLPPGVTNLTVTDSSNNYTSTLQFSFLQKHHSGLYTCRLGGNERLAVNFNITVKALTVGITENGSPSYGHSGYKLSCNVIGIDTYKLSIDYQWSKLNASMQTHINPTNNQNLSFPSPLKLSDAGVSVCNVNVSLPGENYTTAESSYTLYIQIPITDVAIASRPTLTDPIIEGTPLTLTCTVNTDAVQLVDSDWQLFDLEVALFRDNSEVVTFGNSSTTNLTYVHQIASFNLNDSGNYTCKATARAHPSSVFINDSNASSHVLNVTTGVYLKSNCKIYTKNGSIIPISEIGEGDDALLCFTDLQECCQNTHTGNTSGALGDWFYPNGSAVETLENFNPDHGFYKNRDQSVLRLHWRENATMAAVIGQFCCKVPDATSNLVIICINVSNNTSPRMVSGDEHCKPTSTAPVTSIYATTEDTDNNKGSSELDDDQKPESNSSNSAVVAAGAATIFILIIILVIIIIILAKIFLQRRHRTLITHKEFTFQSPVIYSDLDFRNTRQEKQQRTPVISVFPSDVTVTEGEGLYFKIEVSGEPQPTVTWYHDGEPVREDYACEIESDGSLTIPSTELKHSGVYKAVAANEYGFEEREVTLAVRKEEESCNSMADGNQDAVVSSRPIPVLEFGKYVAELHANSNQPFIALYKSLDNGEKDHKASYAFDPERKTLNRFKNVVVYDDNRIVLRSIPEATDCQGDYINACYIDGYSVPDKFIATQGPLQTTLVDFWRLIWQEHPPIIVMVTNVMEGNRIKCQQYWPESGKQQFGPFHVTITDQQIFADYTIRTLSVSLDSAGRSHKVTQYHFTAWPDHGVPDYATSVLAFHRRVKAQHHPSRGPILVHCSAGIGRTGTFIAIDNILEQLEIEKIVDVPGAITKMRQRRMKMVQTSEQFIFIHDAILESVTCGDTQISATNLRVAITKMRKSNGFQYQMKILEQVSPNPKEVQCTTALTYPEKNRDDKFLPADHWRVILKGEQPDYIHAVNVNGYKQKKAFIIAQGPLKSTVRNFWKMIYDRGSAVVVMLSELVEGGEEASAQYWPSSGICQYGEYTVELMGEEPLEEFIIRDISVMDSKTQKANHVTQLHITSWKANGHCSNLKSITDVIEEMTKVQIRSGNKPIVVHCSDTVTRSGMFCAIATTIERCKTEGVVDVFQVVKALRVQKPGAVPTVDNFKLIFDSLLVFLESFDTYANFQNI